VSFDAADPIGSVFADVIGKPCWLAKRGYGSFLTFEFGEPHLHIREPRESDSESEALRRMHARRRVQVRGDWHLWIYCCDWKISRGTERFARHSSRDETIAAGIMELDGQILTDVDVDPLTAATTFSFDLGGQLRTKRWKNKKTPYDQWMLYAPDGNVLTWRDDAHYSWQPADAETARWDRLPDLTAMSSAIRRTAVTPAPRAG
jgi:hypothetical protein